MSLGRKKEITDAIHKILDSPEDAPLCASFRLSNEESPWIQVAPDALNISWTSEDDPTVWLDERAPLEMDGFELVDHEAGVFATFSFEGTSADRLAKCVLDLFLRLYELPRNFPLDIDTFEMCTDEIPDLIPIARAEGYATHIIGHDGEGRPFMAFVAASLPDPIPEDWEQHKRWYAILHRFDEEGQHASTDAWFAGLSADGEEKVILSAEDRLDAMLEPLEPIEWGDVEVALFETEIEGELFGLVDATYEDEKTGAVHVQAALIPNGLVFYPPWEGEYEI